MGPARQRLAALVTALKTPVVFPPLSTTSRGAEKLVKHARVARTAKPARVGFAAQTVRQTATDPAKIWLTTPRIVVNAGRHVGTTKPARWGFAAQRVRQAATGLAKIWLTMLQTAVSAEKCAKMASFV